MVDRGLELFKPVIPMVTFDLCEGRMMEREPIVKKIELD